MRYEGLGGEVSTLLGVTVGRNGMAVRCSEEERDASQMMNIYALHKICINLVMRACQDFQFTTGHRDPQVT